MWIRDNDLEIIGAIFTRFEEAPSHMDRFFQVPFENDSEYIALVEEKLQDEIGVGDLKGFSKWEFRKVEGIGNHDA